MPVWNIPSQCLLMEPSISMACASMVSQRGSGGFKQDYLMCHLVPHRFLICQ